MLSNKMMTVAATLCVFAMLAYLFVFAEADVAGVENQITPAAGVQ
jgi:hypothetical protein